MSVVFISVPVIIVAIVVAFVAFLAKVARYWRHYSCNRFIGVSAGPNYGQLSGTFGGQREF